MEEISGEDLLACNQCGKCSAGVRRGGDGHAPQPGHPHGPTGDDGGPAESDDLDLRLLCLTCVTRCPKGVDLPRLMEALREISLRAGASEINLDQLPPDLVRELPQLAIVGGFRKYIK